MKPLVITVAVHYESVEDCRKMVESLQLIEYANHRIVIVDNCSSEETYLALREALDVYLCELIRSPSNVGFGGGVNFALEYALKYDPDYVHVINTDSIVVQGGYIAELVSILETDSQVGIVGPAVLRTDRKSVQNTILPFISLRSAVLFRRLYTSVSQLEDPPSLREVPVINGVCFMMPVPVFQEIGGFDERYFMYGEEQDLCYYLAKHGYKRLFWSGRSILHFGADRETGFIDWRFLYSRKNQLRFLRKIGRWPEAFLLAILFTGASLTKLLLRRIQFRGESFSTMIQAYFSPIWP